MMQALPVIVGFGGYNAAGRSSSHQGFRRMILESLPPEHQKQTIVSLACLMGLVTKKDGGYSDEVTEHLTTDDVFKRHYAAVIDGTLLRKIEHFDPYNLKGNCKVDFSDTHTTTFIMARRDLPKEVNPDWTILDLKNGEVQITATDIGDLFISSHYELAAKAAGQLPRGFNPANHYNSRFHPRGLQMALLGVSDAVHSVGIPWDLIMKRIDPDELGVYSSSVYGQIDNESLGGLLQGRLKGERTTAKQSALSLNSMPADFINAYVLGNVGHSEAKTGACASFLYALQSAVKDIRGGRCRVAVVGNAEAPITPEMSEGFSNMGALASDENLCRIDNSETPDWRRASRPFSENCGFVLSEAAQYIVLMDDSLAIEIGADIHGAVPDVFINADGIKKSISAPGIGNYISFAKAVAAATEIIGKDAVRKKSFVHAHGSSTPANRVSESDLITRVAEAFEIDNWPVTAVKAYVGHTISAASGDQLISALGTFQYGLIPGIKTSFKIASDVNQDRLNFVLKDLDVGGKRIEVAFINSKGFGGNNATALVLSADKTNSMLKQKYGNEFEPYALLREVTRANAAEYKSRADNGNLDVIYRFGESLIDENRVKITKNGMSIPGFGRDIDLSFENPWSDLK